MTSIAPGNQATVKEFGKYRVLATIARGGMAYVHLAASRGDQGFTKVVVVKEMLEDLSQDPAFRTMFAQEARVAAQLSHPNIVTTFEADAQSERLYMVMEYLDGQPLTRVKKKLGGAMHLPLHLMVLSNVLEALSYAHGLRGYDGAELRIVHRDVTPHNVFVTYAGEVKLVDFGIAKVVSAGADTKVGVVKGKLAYMPPEQARGLMIDHRADLFSVGVMLWEVVTQKRLWAGVEEVDALRMLLEGSLPDILTPLANTPRGLVEVIKRALAPNAKDRYESADAMKRDLDAFRRTLQSVPERADVGRIVAEHFSSERGLSNALIRDQLALASSVATGEFVAQSFASTPRSQNPFAPDVSSRIAPVDTATLGTPPASALGSVPPQAASGGGVKRGLAAFTIILSLSVAGIFGWLLFHSRDYVAKPKPATSSASANAQTPPPTPRADIPTVAADTLPVAPSAVSSAISATPSATAGASSAVAAATNTTSTATPRWGQPIPKWKPYARPTATASGKSPGGVDLGY